MPKALLPAPPSSAFGVVTVLLTLLGWASVPLFLRHFSQYIDLWTSNGWRYGFSALMWAPLLIVLMLRGKTPRGLWMAALIPSVVNAAGQVCFTWAHYCIEPALLTFGLRSQLIFVAIGAWIMFPRERAVIRTYSYLFGAALLIVGMIGVLLVGAPNDDGSSASALSTSTSSSTSLAAKPPIAYAQGVALAVVSGFLFACYGLSVRKYMEGVNPMIAFAAICQYTALAMVILMCVLGVRAGITVLDMPQKQIAWLLISGVIGIAIGHALYYTSIARLGVAVTAGVLQLQPFLVAIGSMMLFNEILSGWQWIGGCLAVSGAMLMLGVQWRMSRQVQRDKELAAIAEIESGS